MRLTSITLENFRCFEKEHIDLHPQLNVFVGLNASGKTALLEGIGLGVGRFFSGLLEEDVEQYSLQASDQRLVPNGGQKKIRYKPKILCEAAVFGLEKVNWIREFRSGEDGISLSHEYSNDLQTMTKEMVNRYKSGEKLQFPVILYFSTQRIWADEFQDEIEVANKDTIFSGYYSALGRKPSTRFFESEFKKMEQIAWQSNNLSLNKDSSRRDLIQRIAGKVIFDCERLYYDVGEESIALHFIDGTVINASQLSDGQKSLLLISTGIAFQCATLNPHMGLDAYKSDGVVLIDEVELHLHPDWQRRILPILTREFPNIQFICTTHSPQVLSMVGSECVQVIKDFHVQPLKAFTLGRDSNSLLSEIFGIDQRPKEYAEKLQHFYTLLEVETVLEAEKAFEELEALWGGMDTEIVRARYFLEDLLDDIKRRKEMTQ